MKGEATLEQKLRADEYVYVRGIRGYAAAEDMVEDMFAAGEVSPAEKPREVGYHDARGRIRWAIALRDTSLAM